MQYQQQTIFNQQNLPQQYNQYTQIQQSQRQPIIQQTQISIPQQAQQVQIISTTTPDPFCSSFNSNGLCVRCSQRYYFNSNKVCTQVSANCNQYDANTGQCTSCYQSYTLFNG